MFSISMRAHSRPFATRVYADAARYGRTAGLKPLEIRERLSESHGGHKVIEFDGGPEAHFTSQFSRARRELASSRVRPSTRR